MAHTLDPFAHGKVFGLGANVLLNPVLAIDMHLVSLPPGLLNHDDKIASIGHLGTGVDFHASSGGNVSLERHAGSGFANASQWRALWLR
jgi:hypothetical protein